MDITGGTSVPAPKGRRFAAAVIDLLIIPIVLGLILGLLLLGVSDLVRSIILVIVNIAWLIFRDVAYSPGRAMVGLKLVSLRGDKVDIVQAIIQAIIRNIMLIVPFGLVPGYLCETTRIFIPNNFNARKILYIVIFVLALLIMPGALVSKQLLIILGMLLALSVPIFFFIRDRADLAVGHRLMDHYAQTRVVSA